MKKAAAAGAVALFVAMIVLVIAGRRRNPVAEILVVDAAGKPVAGATIQPDGYRPKAGRANNGGHYFWNTNLAPNTPVQTDAAGRALIEYPRFAAEQLEVGELSFAVDHPEFCFDRPFRVVDHSPPPNASFWKKVLHRGAALAGRVPRRADPVTLKRGAAVRIVVEPSASGAGAAAQAHVVGSGRFVGRPAGEILDAKDLQVQLVGVWLQRSNFWEIWPDQSLFTRRVAPQQNTLRVVSFRDGAAQFSEPVDFTPRMDVTNELRIALRPGVPVSGALDAAVPRPVSDGVVVAEVWSPANISGRQTLMWHTWAPIMSDGTFELEPLPGGRLEVFALSKGFVSKHASGAAGSQRAPQTWTLGTNAPHVEVQMEPASTMVAEIVDEQGRPVAGAVLASWPNCRWGNWAATVFPGSKYRSSEVVRDKATIDWMSGRVRSFCATSDASGLAILEELPAGTHGYTVEHTAFALPVQQGSRNRTVTLAVGETVTNRVQLHRRGRDVMSN